MSSSEAYHLAACHSGPIASRVVSSRNEAARKRQLPIGVGIFIDAFSYVIISYPDARDKRSYVRPYQKNQAGNGLKFQLGVFTSWVF